MRKANATGRDADARRTIPLNSSAWRKLRADVLIDSPFCVICDAGGVVTRATDVDHKSGDPSDNTPANLQTLCHECHSRKTAHDHGLTVRWGCNHAGTPTNPLHHWNR